jgi:hypothetical protein
MDPPLHPGTRAPLTPQDLLPLFPMELIEQEFSPEPLIDIPGEVMDIYRLWRATPLYRARRLEKLLDTPAHIYYKYEGTSPAGSHKPNTAVPQAYYNKRAGIKRLATETGAGQWGSALSLACQLFGLECTVYMVRVSYDQKPYRRMMMHTWGAEVFPSPSEHTHAGRGVLAATPDSPGSLGIAISEAVEDEVVLDLVYEARDIDQRLGSVDKIDAWFEAKTKGLNDWQKDELKKQWGTMQYVLSSASRMSRVVSDIVFDFSVKPRLSSERGNAMLVASSIYEACKYFELFQKTVFKGRCAVVTSYNPQAQDVTLEETGANTETEKQFLYNTYMALLKDVDAKPGKTKTETYEDEVKELFKKLAECDEDDVSLYPGFQEFFNSLSTTLSTQEVRLLVRSEIRGKVQDARGAAFPDGDFEEDVPLQKALRVVLEKLKSSWTEVPEYAATFEPDTKPDSQASRLLAAGMSDTARSSLRHALALISEAKSGGQLSAERLDALEKALQAVLDK